MKTIMGGPRCSWLGLKTLDRWKAQGRRSLQVASSFQGVPEGSGEGQGYFGRGSRRDKRGNFMVPPLRTEG